MKKLMQALLVSMALIACAFAQTAGASGAQTGTQTTPQTATQPGTTQSAPNQPAGRAPIQAKSQAEFQAYQAAIASAQNGDAMEKAADDFATKFPDSQLRVLLYRAAMHSYQSAGNSGKMMEMGLKVLGIDKDDPEALIGVAEVQEEHTSPTDLDRDQRMTQALANAQHALETVETDLAVPAGTPPDKLEAYKKYLRATSLEIVGTIQYKREQYADAETNLRKAIETDPSNPDPVVILRLALALDQQKKYPEALQQANRAVELTKEDTDVGKMARNERDRLMVQTGGTNAPAPANAPSNTGGSSPTGTAPQSSPTPAAEPPQNGAPPSH
ncbi:MAG TPA: tetratricopeptide repeat protein [Terriglobales bacterium]|nr:tetratricopeptide repeat protein [Terriglobales bacterium]